MFWIILSFVFINDNKLDSRLPRLFAKSCNDEVNSHRLFCFTR
ncbi:hypothetical protein HFN_0278 [Helicobacter fennelliae MRY12-0050]|uniref:Uncharacterized protein n=1 Tax=Helicobacter fennelliae MRY12-0050 TaxID=1325130 RepID=T1DW59_9HELI|nr:hypothetical protein HFN_0278 [Helicobacter fennelliae MRY12-0050]